MPKAGGGACQRGGVGRWRQTDGGQRYSIAVDSARFGFTEARLGLVPATISPYVVRRIGESRARALFLTAERFDAPRALAIGLVHQVVPADQLDATVAHVTNNLLRGRPVALAETKL